MLSEYLNDSLGMVVFGNSFKKQNSAERKPVTLLNPVRKMKPFPDGVCDKPFSVVSLENFIFVIPSAPSTIKSDNGKLLLKMPRVWCFQPHACYNGLWTVLPTPSFPDIEYASLFYDHNIQALCLVLVQSPSSSTESSQEPSAASSVPSPASFNRKRKVRIIYNENKKPVGGKVPFCQQQWMEESWDFSV
jgi:hypothetical protein